jgi:hypothetical protein
VIAFHDVSFGYTKDRPLFEHMEVLRLSFSFWFSCLTLPGSLCCRCAAAWPWSGPTASASPPCVRALHRGCVVTLTSPPPTPVNLFSGDLEATVGTV